MSTLTSKELRVGNWVFDNGREYQFSIYDFTQILPEPIPITSEWLERLGFVNHRKNIYSKEGINFIHYKEGVIYLAGPRHINLFYVHQLQNLFFALTGHE
jgi:hypothetical protein